MENIRLKKENSILEKKKKELLNQIHELMIKNNTLNQEILSLRYSKKDTNISPLSNNNTITELNKTISLLKGRIGQITKEKYDLEKSNTDLKITLNTYKNEKQKQLIDVNKNSNLSEIKKLKDKLNENIVNSENEKKTLKEEIQELTEKNNDINNQISELQKENDKLKQEINDINKINEEYKDKNTKLNKELNDERDINIFNEQNIKDLERKLEEYQINEFDDEKTKTYKINKINKVNEIEMEKLTKKFYNSPYYRKNTSTFSTNNTTNKIIFINNFEELEISPDNYTIIKQFKLTNNLKWYLLKKLKKHSSGQKEENSPSPKPGSKHQSRRYKYFKLNSKSNNNIYNDDSYSDFIWKSNKNEKDFINFNKDIIDDEKNENSFNKEKQKKITELESYIKELEEKLEKKENDCNRINLNYAKLFKRSKMPELSYDKLLDNIDKLKEENKNLKAKIENLKLNQNFIGFSFIEDDLEGSRFIDDNCFEEILSELTNSKNIKDNNDINANMMKFFRSHEDDKDNNSRDNKKIKGGNINYKSDKKTYYYKKDKSKNKNNEEKNDNLKNDNIDMLNKINEENNEPKKRLISKEHINYIDNNYKSPNKYNIISDNKKIININTVNNANNNEDINNNKDIFLKTNRFRKTYKRGLNTNLNLEKNNNDNKDVNNYEISPNKKKINSENDDKLLKTVKTMKFESENKNNEKKMETIQEDTIKINRFYRGRRFYKKIQENTRTININEK